MMFLPDTLIPRSKAINVFIFKFKKYKFSIKKYLSRYKKIKYYPGLISIIILPIICVFFLKVNYDSKRQTAISLTTWSEDFLYDETMYILNNRKFKKVVFTGDLYSDEMKLKTSQKEIQFNFEANSHYKTYVHLLEILQLENATYYIPYKNNIWFTNPTIPKSAYNSLNCGFNPKPINEFEQINEYVLIKYFIEKYYYLGLIYLFLCFLGIRSSIKLFKG